MEEKLIGKGNFPVGLLCLRRADIEDCLGDFACIGIGCVIQILDPKRRPLNADLALGKINVAPTESA